MKVCVTGHRPGDRLDWEKCERGLLHVLRRLKVTANGDITGVCGGADGADRIWWRVLAMSNVPYEVFVARGYKENYKLGLWFDVMIENASAICWTQPEDEKFDWKHNFMRNQQMVDVSDVGVVCSNVHPEVLLDEKSGGTRHAAGLMKKKAEADSEFQVIWVNSVTGESKKIWVAKQQTLGIS